MYLCKFDDDGKRIATVVEGVHYTTAKQKKAYIKEGYVETSDEDYAYYIGNKGTGKNGTGYIRGADGKPTDAPAPPEPSIDEQLAELDSQYEQDKVQLFNYYTEAVMRDDAELQEEIKSELTALDAQYDLDINAIDE